MAFNFIKAKPILLLSILILTTSVTRLYGQAGDLSQIRNGSGDTIKQAPGGWDTCGKCWVNGNAGASNAHYTEGMSIAYRSLLTGLIPGRYYEYEIGFDTYHGAMAIDYLTHFQRLEPHGPFKHIAEVVKPLVFVSGSTEYTMNPTSTDTLSFPAPSASGITTGAFNKDGTPRNISQQARTSFLALPAAQRVMTIYNGDLINICYIQENTIVIGGADAESKMRIRFKADKDSVVLAWGGHIASRLDWGYFKKNNSLVPLSAAGISGSPYHMRQKAFYEVAATKSAGVCDPNVFITNISGFGNQDRSLSAAAVIPPPDCPGVTSLSHCYEDSSFTFSVNSPVAGVTYTWTIGTNTIGAVFSGSNVGTSVTVIAHPGADVAGVNNGGSFSLNINASQNGVGQDCNGVATGTLVDVDVAAAAFSTTINLAVKDTTHLTSTVTGGGTGPFTFKWKALEPGSSFSTSDAIQNPIVTVPHEAGTYTYRVIATDANGCKDSATVEIDVQSQAPPCGISGPTTICPGSTNTYKYDPDNNQTANSIPDNFTAVWKLVANTNNANPSGSTTGNTVSVVAGASCNTSYKVRIVLTSTSGLIKDSCELTVSVNVTNLPTIICPADVNTECSSGIPNPPATQAALVSFFNTAGGSFTGECNPVLSYVDERTNQNCFTFIKRTWTITDGCGNTASCSQTIKVVDRTPPTGTCTASVVIACGATIQTPVYTDNCGGTVTVFFKDYPVGAAANRQPLTRTWTFVDPSGNAATCTQSITFAANCAPSVFKTANDQQVDPTVQQVSPTTKPVSPSTKQTVKPKVSPDKVKDLQVQAYPNPFGNVVNFVLLSPVSGKANLEIYDILGRRLAVVYQGNLQAGVQRTINYKVPVAYKVPIVFKLTVGSMSSRGKLLPDKTIRQ